ncbi:MAG: hypothetical protein BRD51_00335 [Bacteroidetes bacterium SW_11_64_17]|nr:MAG: hypothetical protein BRD51_00335 [Bacteroidetes bacterium SW_11_64_17]
MAVLGSDISIDLHIVGDVELDTIRGIVQNNGRLRPELAKDLRRAIEDTTRDIIEDAGVTGCTLSVNLSLVEETVPGAPRQRVDARLDVEGDRSQLAAVDNALDTPKRARISDAAEACLDERLQERGLTDVVDCTVIVPPVQFR